jgi:hypothetical protein
MLAVYKTSPLVLVVESAEGTVLELSLTALRRLHWRKGEVLVNQGWGGLCRFSWTRLLQAICVTLQ